jgi:hypothetical protein
VEVVVLPPRCIVLEKVLTRGGQRWSGMTYDASMTIGFDGVVQWRLGGGHVILDAHSVVATIF